MSAPWGTVSKVLVFGLRLFVGCTVSHAFSSFLWCLSWCLWLSLSVLPCCLVGQVFMFRLMLGRFTLGCVCKRRGGVACVPCAAARAEPAAEPPPDLIAEVHGGSRPRACSISRPTYSMRCPSPVRGRQDYVVCVMELARTAVNKSGNGSCSGRSRPCIFQLFPSVSRPKAKPPGTRVQVSFAHPHAQNC